MQRATAGISTLKALQRSPQARSERDAALDQLRQAHQYVGEMLAGICDQM